MHACIALLLFQNENEEPEVVAVRCHCRGRATRTRAADDGDVGGCASVCTTADGFVSLNQAGYTGQWARKPRYGNNTNTMSMNHCVC